MSPAIEARDLTRTFKGGAGVHGVDFTVAPGEIHALVGLNGAGKSTLMRLLLGMLSPDRGEASLRGTRIQDATPTLWARVGQLIEYPFAYPELTTRGNLELNARLHGVPRRSIRQVVDAIIDELNLGRYANVRARALSLGNRQRVGLGGALQHPSDVIILDEPTNALDPAGVLLVREALTTRARAGAGILVSSHHLDEVARVADRITVMNAGRIIGGLDPKGVDLEREFFAMTHADDLSREGLSR